MADVIVLSIGTDGNLVQYQDDDDLLVDNIERKSSSGNIVIGADLGADEIQLGSISSEVAIHGDLSVDGEVTANLDMGGNDIVNVDLCAQHIAVYGGRDQSNASNIYFDGPGGVAMNTSGFVLPWDTTLLAISAATNAAETWTAEVHKNGAGLVSGATLSLAAVASGYRNDLSIDFNAGDEVQLYVNGSSVGRPSMVAIFKRRA